MIVFIIIFFIFYIISIALSLSMFMVEYDSGLYLIEIKISKKIARLIVFFPVFNFLFALAYWMTIIFIFLFIGHNNITSIFYEIISNENKEK